MTEVADLVAAWATYMALLKLAAIYALHLLCLFVICKGRATDHTVFGRLGLKPLYRFRPLVPALAKPLWFPC